jgi:hypothetical protein
MRMRRVMIWEDGCAIDYWSGHIGVAEIPLTYGRGMDAFES